MSLDPELITRPSNNSAKQRYSLLPSVQLFSKNQGSSDRTAADHERARQQAAEEGTLHRSRALSDEVAKRKANMDKQREERLRDEFRESRDSLLSVASEFISHSSKTHASRRPISMLRDPNDFLLLGPTCHSVRKNLIAVYLLVCSSPACMHACMHPCMFLFASLHACLVVHHFCVYLCSCIVSQLLCSLLFSEHLCLSVTYILLHYHRLLWLLF